jgi:hypothetical protein
MSESVFDTILTNKLTGRWGIKIGESDLSVDSSDGSVRGDSITVSTSPNTESSPGSRMVNPIESPDSLDGLPMLLYAMDGVDSEIE